MRLLKLLRCRGPALPRLLCLQQRVLKLLQRRQMRFLKFLWCRGPALPRLLRPEMRVLKLFQRPQMRFTKFMPCRGSTPPRPIPLYTRPGKRTPIPHARPGKRLPIPHKLQQSSHRNPGNGTGHHPTSLQDPHGILPAQSSGTASFGSHRMASLLCFCWSMWTICCSTAQHGLRQQLR
jgi:hypothetical protein